MLIFRGWGSIAALIVAGAIGAGFEGIGLGRSVAYVFGGAGCLTFGLWVNHLYEAAPGHHALFWIPIEFWGVVIAIGTVAGS